MIRLNQSDLNQYLKKTEAEQIYMKKINSINMSFTSILTSIQSLVATYDYQFSTLNVRVGQIEDNTGSHLTDIQSIQSWQNSAYSSITNLENQTLYLNNEFYSIKTNTDQIASNTLALSNLISTLTGGIGYDYWNEFSKASNETYMDYALNSTVVKNEQITYNGNLSQSISNADKKEFVLNQNLLNIVFTIESPVARLGLKLNSTNSPLRATANTIDLAAYDNVNLNNSFNLKCQSLNLINSGGNVNSLGSNVWANNINFNGFNSASTYSLNFNANVQNISGFPNSVYLYLTNNGNNMLNMDIKSGRIIMNNNDTLKNFSFSTGTTIIGTNAGGNATISNIKVDTYIYFEPSVHLGNIDICNCSGGKITFNESCNYFNIHNNDISYFLDRNGEGWKTETYSYNTFSNLNMSNVYNATFLSNTILNDFNCRSCKASGMSLKDNSIYSFDMEVSTALNTPFVFQNNTISSLLLEGKEGSYVLNNLVDLKSLKVNMSSCAVYSSNVSIGNNRGQSNTYRSFTIGTFSNYRPMMLDNFSCSSLLMFSNSRYSDPINWRYATIDNINFQDADSSIFFNNMLNLNYAFFHIKMPNLWQGVEGAFQNANNTLDFASEVLVDNPVTTSVNLMITPNANRRLHANFMSLQPSIKSVNLKGWLPSQIVDFDQYYMFNNIASGLVNEAVNFTLNVDAVSDWINYKQFFNPFGDNDPDRIIIDQN